MSLAPSIGATWLQSVGLIVLAWKRIEEVWHVLSFQTRGAPIARPVPQITELAPNLH